MSLEDCNRPCLQNPPAIQQIQDQIHSTCEDIIVPNWEGQNPRL
jgi:hypothetical protein